MAGVLASIATASQTQLATEQIVEAFSALGPSNDNVTGGRVLSRNACLATIYIADPQFEYLGRRGFTHNPLIKWFVEPPTATPSSRRRRLWVDELIRLEKKRHEERRRRPSRKCYQAIEEKGDVADTPLVKEIERPRPSSAGTAFRWKDTRVATPSGNIRRLNLSSPWYDRLHSRLSSSAFI
jgi:hypothetical protein